MSIVESRVRGLLVSLGDTHIKVAKSLKKAKITGRPCRASDHEGEIPCPVPATIKYASTTCPIGNYLHVKGVIKPRVGRHFTWFYDPVSKRTARIENTAAIACFVGDFDEGDFPELETP